MEHPFTDEELTRLFEATRVIFGVQGVVPLIAYKTDLNEDVLDDLHKKLETFMNPEESR